MSKINLRNKHILVMKSKLLDLNGQKIKLMADIKSLRQEIKTAQRDTMTAKQMENIKKARGVWEKSKQVV